MLAECKINFPGGWVAGLTDNKANSAQLGLAGAWAELGKNVLYVMKRILYDMGHLTVAKWPLQRTLKYNIQFCPRSLLRRVSLHGGCQKHPGVVPQILG